MKIAVREDSNSALPLMEAALRKGTALAPDYPLVFSDAGSGRVVVAEERGEVLSTCALLERELRYGTGSIQVGLIGSVSTAVAARGRGLASAVLECAESELRSRGCLISMLWADAPEFYAARGYSPIGAERDYVLDLALAAELPRLDAVRAAGPGDYQRMHDLYAAHPQRVQRSADESALLFATPGMRSLVCDRSQGGTAYVCLGRGGDLAGVVHEWAGDADSVLACLRSLLESAASEGSTEPLFLLSPNAPNEVCDRLDSLGAASALGVLSMGKLLDVEGAADLLVQACDDALDWRIAEDGSCLLSSRAHRARLSHEQWLATLFPARGDLSWIRSLEAALETRFKGLPWSAFLWGLDSI